MTVVHRMRAAAGAAAVTLCVLAAPIVTGQDLIGASAATSAVTVTATTPAWDPIANQILGSLPTVTVSQTEDLLDQVVHVAWTNFTPSSNDLLYSGAPTPPVTFQPGNVLYPVEVLQCRGTDPTNSFLNDPAPDCYAFTPGVSTADHGAGNAIQSVTSRDGSGFADIHVETSVANDFLGCDSRHACSIAVVPNWGGDQIDGQQQDCADHANDFPTEANGFNYPPFANAADDHLGGACSWADRIVVPIHFAATPRDCPAHAFSFAAAGSPMLARAMTQWQAGWCSGPAAISFDYDSSSNEYLARKSFLAGGSGALTSSTDVAMVTQPPDPSVSSTRRHTYAPLATTAIVVAYLVDDPATGTLLHDLRLNARLLAKLLTQSYGLLNFNCAGGNTGQQSATCDPAVAGNPDSIFTDPEFLALNPQLTSADLPTPGENSIGAFLPTVVGGDSDLTFELTRWIAADPDAAAFLAGKPDPGGMTVNSYYRGIAYPTAQLQQLDPGYTDPTAPPGNGTMQNAWQPVNGLDNVGNLLVSNTASTLSNSVSACAAAPCPFPKVTELAGNRALFAIMDAGQAAAYAFPAAMLVNGGRAAVGPTTGALNAAVNVMTTNPDNVTQRANPASTDAGAYPLTVVDYAMVPTCGLSAAKSGAVADFLDLVGNSQINGLGPGQLAQGYQTLNASQLANTVAAAKAVRDQPACTTPPPTLTQTQTSSGSRTSGTTSANRTIGQGNAVPGAVRLTTSPSAGTTTSATPVSAAQPTPKLGVVSFGVKQPDQAGPAGMVLPSLLVAGGVVLLAGPGLYLLSVTGAGATFRRTVKRLVRR